MSLLLLVRHGETEWNRDRVFRGRRDIDLSERGVEQAARLGRSLAGVAIDAVYASPLARALDTARPIASPRTHDVHPIHNLIDIDYGDWSGLSHADVRAKYPQQYQQWETAPHEALIPGGETLEAVRARAMPAVEWLLSEHADCVVVVSHRVVLKVLVLSLLGMGLERFWSIKLDTASVSAFQTSPHGYVLTHLNDTSHLADLINESEVDF